MRGGGKAGPRASGCWGLRLKLQRSNASNKESEKKNSAPLNCMISSGTPGMLSVSTSILCVHWSVCVRVWACAVGRDGEIWWGGSVWDHLAYMWRVTGAGPMKAYLGPADRAPCGWAGEQSRVLAKAKDANLRGRLLLLQAHRNLRREAAEVVTVRLQSLHWPPGSQRTDLKVFLLFWKWNLVPEWFLRSPRSLQTPSGHLELVCCLIQEEEPSRWGSIRLFCSSPVEQTMWGCEVCSVSAPLNQDSKYLNFKHFSAFTCAFYYFICVFISNCHFNWIFIDFTCVLLHLIFIYSTLNDVELCCIDKLPWPCLPFPSLPFPCLLLPYLHTRAASPNFTDVSRPQISRP